MRMMIINTILLVGMIMMLLFEMDIVNSEFGRFFVIAVFVISGAVCVYYNYLNKKYLKMVLFAVATIFLYTICMLCF